MNRNGHMNSMRTELVYANKKVDGCFPLTSQHQKLKIHERVFVSLVVLFSCWIKWSSSALNSEFVISTFRSYPDIVKTKRLTITYHILQAPKFGGTSNKSYLAQAQVLRHAAAIIWATSNHRQFYKSVDDRRVRHMRRASNILPWKEENIFKSAIYKNVKMF